MTPLLLAALVTVHLNSNGIIRAHSIDKAAAADLEFAARAGDNAVQLPEGQWSLAPSAPGFWGEPVLVTNDTRDVSLQLVPAARLRAQIKLPDRSAQANEVSISLQTIDSVDVAHAETRVATCPITKGRIDCDVPAGVQDVVFRIRGFSSVYRWNANVAAPLADLGVLAFKRGSTLSGRVEPLPKDGRVDVELAPSVNANENDELRARKSVTRIVTHPNARGTFVFDVSPGRYAVRATAGKLVSEEREVTVTEGHEVVLREPLRLEPKRSITVTVQPPVDPWQQAWRATLTRRGPNGAELGERSVNVPETGVARFDDALPGWYELVIHRSDIDSWFATGFDVNRDIDIVAPIRFMRLRGRVSLGEHPLAGSVTFSDDVGRHLPVKTQPDGTFVTLLPAIEGDRWPYIEALLTVVAPTGEMNQVETNNASVTLDGLAAGRYKLSAMARGTASEAAVPFDLPDDGTLHEATVTVGPIKMLQGQVRSSVGPVINASVFATPANDSPPVVFAMPVDAEGKFQTGVPATTREIVAAVAAPGFAFRMMRIPVTRELIEIALEQNGGRSSSTRRTMHTSSTTASHSAHTSSRTSATDVRPRKRRTKSATSSRDSTRSARCRRPRRSLPRSRRSDASPARSRGTARSHFARAPPGKP